MVTVYQRADGKKSAPVSSEDVGKKNGLGYNPAVEAKGFTKAQVDKVRSKKSRSEVSVRHTTHLQNTDVADNRDMRHVQLIC